jgi:hypothetical protein
MRENLASKLKGGTPLLKKSSSQSYLTIQYQGARLSVIPTWMVMGKAIRMMAMQGLQNQDKIPI